MEHIKRYNKTRLIIGDAYIKKVGTILYVFKGEGFQPPSIYHFDKASGQISQMRVLASSWALTNSEKAEISKQLATKKGN